MTLYQLAGRGTGREPLGAGWSGVGKERTMGEGSPSGQRRVLGVALTLALLGGLYYAVNRVPGPAPEAAAPPATEVASVPAAVPAVEPEPEPVVEPDAADAGAPAAETAPEPAVAAPVFDVVRVEPDGSAAVAGTAEPGSTVTVYADDAPLAEVEADAEGNFVAILKVEPSAEPRALTLGSAGDGGTARSEDVVMLLPKAPALPAADAAPEAGTPPVLAAEPAAQPAGAEVAAVEAPSAAEAESPAVEAAAVAPGAAGEPEAAPAAAAEAAPQVAATALLRGDEVEVLPPPGDPADPRRVTLASISYAEAGKVTLAGVGTAGSVLRVYVDDQLAEEAQVADDGRWEAALGDLATGVYRLRIDQIAGDGKVASRVETPFQRDMPHAPPPRPVGAAGPGEPATVDLGPGSVSVTVQPGHNLWTLARARYGSGVMYTQILTANRELIRDPDLIYPGQIFTLPAPDAGN